MASSTGLASFVAGLLIAVVTAPVGVSGAVSCCRSSSVFWVFPARR
jgi:hypothetical protein